MRGRWTSLVVGGVLVLAACGSTASESPDAAPAGAGSTSSTPATAATDDASTEQSATMTTVEANPSADDATQPSATAPEADTDAAPEAGTGDDSQSETGSTASSEPGAATPATPVPPTDPPAEALPDDGCSADNSPTEPNVADGPLPAIDVRAASVDNPLPDLAVRRINCAGGWVNLKNEIPTELPLLVWFWAPH